MNLVQSIDTVGNNHVTLFEQHHDVFEGLGCVTDVQYHIRIDPTKTPPPCRVPITNCTHGNREGQCTYELGEQRSDNHQTWWLSNYLYRISQSEPSYSVKAQSHADHWRSNNTSARCHLLLSSGCQLRLLANQSWPRKCQALHIQQPYWSLHVQMPSIWLIRYFQKVLTEVFDDIDGVEVVVDDILVWGEQMRLDAIPVWLKSLTELNCETWH